MKTGNERSKDHRNRKNGASREAWIREKRKNRPKQKATPVYEDDGLIRCFVWVKEVR